MAHWNQCQAPPSIDTFIRREGPNDS